MNNEADYVELKGSKRTLSSNKNSTTERAKFNEGEFMLQRSREEFKYQTSERAPRLIPEYSTNIKES